MDIPTIRERIKAQQELFFTEQNGGVGKAFRYVPREFLSTELPAFITQVRDATYTSDYSPSFTESRVFALTLYVGNLTKREEGDVEADAETLIAKVQNFWGKRSRLELNGNDIPNDITSSILIGDAGMRSGNFPNVNTAPPYLILEFRLRVVWERHVEHF